MTMYTRTDLKRWDRRVQRIEKLDADIHECAEELGEGDEEEAEVVVREGGEGAEDRREASSVVGR